MSGVTMAAHLIKQNILKPWEFRIMDQNADYGGVWMANHYPGAACDVPSHGYVMRYFLNPGKFLLHLLKSPSITRLTSTQPGARNTHRKRRFSNTMPQSDSTTV